MTFDIERLQSYPESPGVYIMKESQGSILYIGKAKNLKVRLRQYFMGADDRFQVPALVAAIHDIETIIVPTEKDALLLEARLIRRWKPKYNILLKDDRSRLMLRLGFEHMFPRIEYIRSKDVSSKPPQAYGPFQNTKELFDITVRLFQLRQCSDEEFKRRKTPCILHQMHRCSAPCVGLIDQEKYQKTIASASDFLSGKIATVRASLYEEMGQASQNLEFERAQNILNKIKFIDKIAGQKESDRIDRLGNRDVVGFWYDDLQGASFSIARYRDSLLQAVDVWTVPREEAYGFQVDFIDTFASSLIQLYQDPSSTILQAADQILVPQQFADITSLVEEGLREIHGTKVTVRCPKSGVKAELIQLAIENAKAALIQKNSTSKKIFDTLEDLRVKLMLPQFPSIIDCFDASHFSGSNTVATVVSFQDGSFCKKRYRTYLIKNKQGADDIGSLKEAIQRRYKVTEDCTLPDLIIVDGGPTQLHAAHTVLVEEGLDSIPLISLAKESGRHDRGSTKEKVYLLSHFEPILLPEGSSSLHFLQRIRDEAHRFSIEFQKKQRSKGIRKSVLDDIPGIGPQKKKRLLSSFFGIRAIQQATVHEIMEKSGLSLKDAEAVHKRVMIVE